MATLPHPVTGTFACWGKNPGIAESTFATKTELASGPVKELAFSERLTCALHDTNVVQCYGDVPAPVPMNGTGPLLAGGPDRVCAYSSEGVECRGLDSFDAKPWARGTKVRAVAIGARHMCASYEGKGVQCQGDELAAGDAAALAGLDVLALAAGEAHTCALLGNHTVKCWGKNDSSQLGDRTTNDTKAPVQVIGLEYVARITSGARHMCALLGNGTVHCWGNNAHHQLANGGTQNDGAPKMVLGILGVSHVSAAADGTCAILSKDGEVRCWGSNDAGQLGDSTKQEHTVPAPVRFH